MEGTYDDNRPVPPSRNFSSALVPTPKEEIYMWTAVWHEDLCLRRQGQECTICVDRCPMGAAAIKLNDIGQVEVIEVKGSVELAPLVGLADAIVDLVSSGGTLRANKLVEVEDITPISSRLIVNQAAMKNRGAQLQPLIDAFSRASLDE